MLSGYVNIIFGVGFIIGGLTGKLGLRGSHDGTYFAIFGAFLVLLGLARLAKRRMP